MTETDLREQLEKADPRILANRTAIPYVRLDCTIFDLEVKAIEEAVEFYVAVKVSHRILRCDLNFFALGCSPFQGVPEVGRDSIFN